MKHPRRLFLPTSSKQWVYKIVVFVKLFDTSMHVSFFATQRNCAKGEVRVYPRTKKL